MDAALALDRGHRPRGAAHPADLLQVALRLRDRSVLAGSIRPPPATRQSSTRTRSLMCLAADPHLPARADARLPPQRGHRGRCSRSALPAMATSPRSSPRFSPTPTSPSAPGLRCRALRSKQRLDIALAAVALLGGYFIRQQQFGVLPVGRRTGGRIALVHGPARPGPAPQLDPRRHVRRRDPLPRRALPVQPRGASAHRAVAVHDAALQEPHGRSRAQSRPLVHDRARSPARDRRPYLASPARASRRPDLPRLRRVDRLRNRARLDLHRGQGRVPLHPVLDALGGARPDLPLAADAARNRHGARVDDVSTGGSSGAPSASSP